MKIKFYGRVFVGLIIISLFILPIFTYAQKQKIRVVVENASIRSKPSMESEVIGTSSEGIVFEVEKKIGEWYEIKFASRVGVMITGYIHEMLVELEREVPEPERRVAPPPRKEAVQPPPPPQFARRPREFKRFNIFLYALIPIYSLSETTEWSDSWSFQYLSRVNEGGKVTLDNREMGGGGVGLVFMFTKNFGIEGRLDTMGGNVWNTSSFYVDWTWSAAVGGGTYSEDFTYDSIEGEVDMSPISINLYARFPMGRNFIPYVSGGLTFFIGNFVAETDMGDAASWYFMTWPYETQYVDWFTYKYWIGDPLNGIGGNIGAGLAMHLSRTFSINMETRYFIGPTKSFKWEIERGREYWSLNHNFQAPDDFLDWAEELMSEVPVKVKTSFPSINIGLNIGFNFGI